MLGEEPPGVDSGVGQTAQPLGSGWDVIPRAESPLFIYSIPTVQIPSLPPPPQIDRAPDSCSPDHGVALCMISCWFSRHCFSLSSVSVSRCSRMETVWVRTSSWPTMCSSVLVSVWGMLEGSWG